MFKKIPDMTVADTIPTRFRMNRMNMEVRLSNIPLAVIAPPKHMAQIISQMVFIMPLIPRVVTRSLSIALPVSIPVLP